MKKITSFLKSFSPLTTFLIIIAIGITFIYGAIKYQKIISQKIISVKQESPFNYVKLEEAKVDEFYAKSKDVDNHLKLKDDQWQINDKLANQDAVKQIFSDLEKLDIAELVSQTDDGNKSVGTDDETAVSLTFSKEGKEVAKVLIGKSGASIDSFFIRNPKNKNTYLAYGALRRRIIVGATEFEKKEAVDTGPTTPIPLEGPPTDISL
ncbi:hypothetical protein COT51_01390 [candidate division WWE3 bacterium CG08_land_8_20_14_0_20_41_15]|uniref:DUF4340 domain-containing protein n=1 Tax=candidate division WWE3 bacterium CG08_land_8_20_14_0_20_41_15 TaxID=1975086 RepID=A0A2H0X9U5_UNCKA|nr:MAG: hypothetical protein COT51_01390 [candidate division WWE3 bacterium CG08_land_8_20_14_0_20_41_15]